MKIKNDQQEIWDKLNNAFEYFLDFLTTTPQRIRYDLTSVELVLVSNFKGGNSSITEPLESLRPRLVAYSEKLKEIAELADSRPLRLFNTLTELQRLSSEFLDLTQNAMSKIAGLGPAYASAVLAGYFPETLPVIDRHVLRGARVEHKVNSQRQVIDLQKHYPLLLERFREELVRRPELSLRELDRIWFMQGRKLNKDHRLDHV